MVGAYFILNDPIFNGLAISLVFGLAMSTLLTVLVVPLLRVDALRRHCTTGRKSCLHRTVPLQELSGLCEPQSPTQKSD